jgi:hypothetical protein
VKCNLLSDKPFESFCRFDTGLAPIPLLEPALSLFYPKIKLLCDRGWEPFDLLNEFIVHITQAPSHNPVVKRRI